MRRLIAEGRAALRMAITGTPIHIHVHVHVRAAGPVRSSVPGLSGGRMACGLLVLPPRATVPSPPWSRP